MPFKTAINPQKLEAVLLKTWTQFLDHDKLFAATLEAVRESQGGFARVAVGGPRPRTASLSLSRFAPSGGAFEVWAEFRVPVGEGAAAGTAEFRLGLDGTMVLTGVIGSFLDHIDPADRVT